jgi:hypothetical protein
MTDEPTRLPDHRAIARDKRLGEALRENLKRRKSQSRGRTDRAAAPPIHGGPDAVASRSDSKPLAPDETT